uniref:C2H2-type domain-containing protein n=2 Tax=Brassica oleracea var. oleracea TaxID=109376 RepID=A0A0D3DG45_BRAOL
MASLSQIFLILIVISSSPFCSGGSRKELRDKDNIGESYTQSNYVVGSKSVDPRRVLQLSWQPRVFLYRGFLSEEECDHLAKETSEVKSGDGDGKTHLSSSDHLLDVPDPIVAGIEERISAWTFLPRGSSYLYLSCFSVYEHSLIALGRALFLKNSGPIKVRSYSLEKPGNKLDYFGDESSSVSHESLLATVILYVSNTTQGGELLFPNAEVKLKRSWSDCSETGETGNILRPVKGNAVLFFSRHLNATLDQTSTHFRCPVLKGELLVATKLIYAKKQARKDEEESGECSDEDESCGRWAELGECKKNPVYMIGSPDYFGTCRKSLTFFPAKPRGSLLILFSAHARSAVTVILLNSMELVKQDGNDSLDMLIRRAVGKDPFLSFPRPDNNPVQLFQLLHNLERPGWPLLTPLKIELQKCEKCTREFCSPVNHRRHSRVHRRPRKPEKDSSKQRDALGEFWDKLSVVDAKEILSLKSLMLEDVAGESVESGLVSLIEKPGYTALPQYYLRAGSDLLDIIQARTPRFSISSQKLFSILDEASEKTFLCNEAAPMQKYIFDGEIGKNMLEAKNVVACTSFLLEQKLIKAWLADKDAEALRCQNLLVEEEEAAQRRQADLLERKKRKKLRQKEQRAKDQKKEAKEDESTTSEEQHSPAESSSPLSIASDSEAQRSDSIPIEDSSSLEEPQVLEMDNGRNSETQAPMVDDDGFGNGQNMERRSGRRQMEKRSQHGMPNGFHGNHAPKLGGIRKNGTHRDVRGNITKVWSRKANNPNSLSPEAAVDEQDQTKNSEVLIGSVSVTIRNTGEHNQTKSSEEERRMKTVEAKPTSEKSTVKVWRPVSSQGRINENTDKKDKISSSTVLQVKTAHHISLHEAKAFLAKRWKEATSEEHVTLVLSQETDMSGNNNTHESSNGVITAARPKHRKKREKGTKVKYVPKQSIP